MKNKMNNTFKEKTMSRSLSPEHDKRFNKDIEDIEDLHEDTKPITKSMKAKPMPELSMAPHVPIYQGGGYWDGKLGCSVHWVRRIWPPEIEKE